MVESSEANYSSSEYLAHKQESVRRSRLEDVTSYSSPYLFTGNINDPRVSKTTKQKVDFYLDPASRDAVITSSVTLPDLHSRRADMEYPPPKDYGAMSDTETSPPSDSTPAMPLLDDVKERSRQIIHGIGTGSRPVSAEFNFSGGVEGEGWGFFMYAVYLHVIGLRNLSLVSKGAILVFLECMLVRYLKYAWSICSIDLFIPVG